MISAEAPAKINLALVVGGTRPDGLHEVATILQRIDLCDTVSLESAAGLSVDGFVDDTIVRRALESVAAAGRRRAQLARADREEDPGGSRSRWWQQRRCGGDQAGLRASRRAPGALRARGACRRPRRRRPVLPRARPAARHRRRNDARADRPAAGLLRAPRDAARREQALDRRDLHPIRPRGGLRAPAATSCSALPARAGRPTLRRFRRTIWPGLRLRPGCAPSGRSEPT